MTCKKTTQHILRRAEEYRGNVYMLTRMPQLLSMRPPSPLPIVPGEYGHALLQTYENVYGPAIGSDVAYAVESYAKAGGHFPHRDAGAEGLQRMQTEFGEHLHRNAERFSGDFGAWLAKMHPQHAFFPHLDVNPEEAAERALDRTYSFFADHISLCIEHEQTVFASILEEAHAFLKSKPDTDSIKRIAKRAQHAQNKEIQMIQTVAEPCRAIRARELALGVSSVKHELINLHASRDWAHSSIQMTLASLTHEDTDVGKVVASLEKEALSRTQTMAKLATTAYRKHLIHTLEQIDRDVLTPLEEATRRLADDPENTELAAKVRSLAIATGASNTNQNELCKMWEARLIELLHFLRDNVPGSDEIQADISYCIHKLGGPRSNVYSTLENIAFAVIPTRDHPNTKNILDNIEWFRPTIEDIRTIDVSMPALRYAHRLGARVVMEAKLPEEIDDSILRKIFDYFIGNAIDIHNKFPRKYTDGEEFEIIVTVRADSIEISDNGSGTTPERLAEIRRAIANGIQLESDHGGTGRGLAVDVGQVYLRQLFPNASDAMLTIDSTLGVGWTGTIHYPELIIRKG